MITVGPRTDREKIIAEASYLQGFEEGVRSITEKLRQGNLKALASMEDIEAKMILDKTKNAIDKNQKNNQ